MAVAIGANAIWIPAQAVSMDPLQSRQWGLSKVHAPRAWSKTQGAGITVAVIDTGVDTDHEDLKGRLLPGRDFVDGDNNPQDEHGHGSLVAGIIAAEAGNGVGVAGVAPKARILPVRALDDKGRGEPEKVAEAIRWTISQEADVINLSLTVDQESSSLFGDLFADRQVELAIEDAARAGILVLIASGNEPSGGKNQTAYDAKDPQVLVVGASTKDDQRAAYSNYGTGLDVVAPGGGNTTQGGNNGCKDPNWIISTWWTPTGNSAYGATCGTSMATAYASGVGALLRSLGMSAADAADRMKQTAKDLGSPGVDPVFGAGRIDAAKAVGAKPVKAASTGSAPKPSASTPSGPPRKPVISVTPTMTQPTSSPSESIVAVPPFDSDPSGTDEAPVNRPGILVAIAAMAATFAALMLRRKWLRLVAVRSVQRSQMEWPDKNPDAGSS